MKNNTQKLEQNIKKLKRLIKILEPSEQLKNEREDLVYLLKEAENYKKVTEQISELEKGVTRELSILVRDIENVEIEIECIETGELEFVKLGELEEARNK